MQMIIYGLRIPKHFRVSGLTNIWDGDCAKAVCPFYGWESQA